VYFFLIFFLILFAINLEEFYIVAKIKKYEIDLIRVKKGSEKKCNNDKKNKNSNRFKKIKSYSFKI
tara:strand:- start:6173 stop:6370 length:198 start_codon:yes stop_codon:yes gene_type:complete